MTSFQILDIKGFMSRLLLKDTFDHFLTVEADITTFASFSIDGRLKKDYFTQEELEASGGSQTPFAFWSQVRPFCLDLIKGKRTPLGFKIVFALSPSNTEKLLSQSAASLNLSDVEGLFLNLRYDGQRLSCITGTSLNLFTLDKSLERTWDEMVEKFFKKIEIPFEH